MLSSRPTRIALRQARLHTKPVYPRTNTATETYVLENLDQLYKALEGMTIQDVNRLVALSLATIRPRRKCRPAMMPSCTRSPSRSYGTRQAYPQPGSMVLASFPWVACPSGR